MEIYKNLELNDLPNEIWKDIEGYEVLYAVSNMGRVKSLDYNHTKQEKILKQVKNKNGYLKVNLCKEGKIKTCSVHRLVANAFLENPNGYRCVNHKDEDKTNNRAENLEPCDHQYNSTYGTCIQRRVAHTDYKAFQARRVAHTDYKAIGRKITEKLSRQVYQYSPSNELVAIWESASECGRNSFDKSAVSKCCNGKLKYYKNYIWSYTPIDSK